MAVLQVIRNLFVPSASREITFVEPAPATTYRIARLAENDLDEVLRLNLRCFKDGENYTRHTFTYLLNQPNALCYRSLTTENRMAGFLCVLIGENGAGHITTIGVAPEHRRRGIAASLLARLDADLKHQGVGSVVLEVRVGNVVAQRLYETVGFSVVQRLEKYYNNGEDGFMMVKSLI